MNILFDAQLKRLSQGTYGVVADAQNQEIRACVTAPLDGYVIEIGCGYGKFISSDPLKSRLAVGCGIDLTCMVMGRTIKAHKSPYFVCCSAFEMPFGDRSFHTVVLRESLHHLRTPNGGFGILEELARICAYELIIFDPQVNILQKVSRWLVKHKDDVVNYSEAVKALEKVSFKVKSLQFRDLLAFPLSGGLVGPDLLRANTSILRMFLRIDDVACRLLDMFLPLKQILCWRYLLVAIRS